MKMLKEKFLAAKIEYHWWCVDRIKKIKNSVKRECKASIEKYHRFKAEQLMIEYEFSLGLRDEKGRIIG